jgi:hypothetical protein
MSKNLKQYLGDGVYIDYNGFDCILTTEDGISTTNQIVMEPKVIEAFNRYLEWLKKAVLS